MARALETAKTAAGLARYRRKADQLIGTGAVAAVPAVALGLVPWAGTLAEDAGALLGAVTVLCLGFGLASRGIGKRMERVLGAGSWSTHAAAPMRGTWGSAVVVLASPDGRELWPLRIVASRQRYGMTLPGPNAVLWWCGDPLRGGVISPPGGAELFWTKPVRGTAARRRVLARAERQGLPGRLRAAVPVPRAGLSGPPAPPVLPPERPARRRRGVWRWVLLTGAVLLGLGIAGAERSDGDPQVDLTVLSGWGEERCTVRWKDPFDGTTRTGPYHCSTGMDPILKGWDTGFVVSYGPWKGDLYNADWEGAPVNQVVEVLGLSGLAGVFVGLGGGAVSRWRRRAITPVSYAPPETEDASPVSLVKEGGGAPAPAAAHAVLAAQAERQAGPGPRPPRRPEADVREVPWWRVRGLRRASGLQETLLSAVFFVIVLAAVLSGFAKDVEIPAYVLTVLTGGSTVVSGFRLLRNGRPVALLVVRAATAPVPVVRRYVLLHDPNGDLPLLVVFPGHGGPDDRPEGLIPLTPPGPSKNPRLGLPEEPVGEVELRGWLDRAEDGSAVVVPWVGGHPLWPLEPYREAGTAAFAEWLEWLAPPSRDAPRDAQEEGASG